MPEDIHWQKYAARFRTFPARLRDDGIVAGMAVCIPVYAEPDLITTLNALLQCDLPDTRVEVLLLFNQSQRMTANETRQHAITWEETIQWIQHEQHQKQGIAFLAIDVNILPDPKGGVGWARKMVMDEAARRLCQEGIILCLDADCTVVKNYLCAVYDFFMAHDRCEAASIYFEHQVDQLPDVHRKAIIQYELHLRYLVHALRWAGHPFAYHTVGSAMAVRRRAYLVQGGMNTRQAGEDFYFLQKFAELGTLREITTTTVYPSARISSRVPFGTGRAMLRLLPGEEDWMTTGFTVFLHIQPLLKEVDKVRAIVRQSGSNATEETIGQALNLEPGVTFFLRSIGFATDCLSIEKQTTNNASFRKRFFRYFNAFMMIRYMHFSSREFIPEVQISFAAAALVNALNGPALAPEEPEKLLEYLRSLDKTS